MQYIKQLDSIRGIAVLLVMLSHWVPSPFSHLGAFIGVNTFFVLSGFLISNILFSNKNEAEATGNSKIFVLKNFFFRRALRIFPIYFFLVFTLLLLGENRIPAINYDIKYLLTFTINFHIYFVKHFGKYTAHLWSLAVEEQFYLVWPWLMLFLKRKFIAYAILIIILIGSISELFIKDEFGYLITVTCLAAFGLGALLSWVYTYKPRFLPRAYQTLSYITLAEILLLIPWILGFKLPTLPLRTLISIIALWIITYIVLNKESNQRLKFSFLLNNSKLIFIGKISYGFYLYHIYIPYLTFNLLTYLEVALPNFLKPYAFILYFINNFFLALLLSWLSWRFVEIPILRLKKFFNYQAPSRLPEKQVYTSSL